MASLRGLPLSLLSASARVSSFASMAFETFMSHDERSAALSELHAGKAALAAATARFTSAAWLRGMRP